MAKFEMAKKSFANELFFWSFLLSFIKSSLLSCNLYGKNSPITSQKKRLQVRRSAWYQFCRSVFDYFAIPEFQNGKVWTIYPSICYHDMFKSKTPQCRWHYWYQKSVQWYSILRVSFFVCTEVNSPIEIVTLNNLAWLLMWSPNILGTQY